MILLFLHTARVQEFNKNNGMKNIFMMLLAALLFSGCRAVVVDKPEPPTATIIPNSPGPDYVWINDSWDWNNRTRVYVLQPGRWVEPRRNAVWVDGRWVRTRGGWKYIRGHWRRR